MENNNSFTLKDVIFNLLFIILFVFILLWLFPSKSFLNNNGINGNVSNEVKVNQIFNQNINEMKEAAISYFTTSRLPKNVGDSVTLTLKQMRDKKLLLSLIDSNGNTCDEGASYIEMTKEKDEYLLKITLSCADHDDYILVHLGCYDYCEGDICEKEEPEEILYKYQYKLETPCKWSDWSNWSNWSTTYVGANNNRKVETKVETESINSTISKSCPAGYLYSSHTNKCYKSSNSTDAKDANLEVSYKCEDGYTFDEANKKCKKEVTTTTTVSAKQNPVTYNCNAYSGYTLNGTKCVKTITKTTQETIDGTPNYDYECEEGTITEDKTQCIVPTRKWSTFPATKSCSTKTVLDCSTGSCSYVPQRSCTYSCPVGFTKNGTNCSGVVAGSKKIESTEVITSYSCPEGYKQDGAFCKKDVKTTSTDTKNATQNPITYYCEDKTHTLEGKLCKYEVTNAETKDPEVINTYNCNTYEGYVLSGNKCEKIVTNTDTKDVILTTTCPNGYKLNNNKCIKNITKYRYSERKCTGGSIDYKWSELDNDKTLLDKGYVLTGQKEQLNSK